MHHVVVRRGNVTSVRDVVLVVFALLFVVRIHCDSMLMFSLSCFEHEEFNLFVSIVDQALAQSRSQLNLSGSSWCGDFAKHRSGSSYLQISSGVVDDFFIIRIIVWNRNIPRCSLAASSFGFSSAH